MTLTEAPAPIKPITIKEPAKPYNAHLEVRSNTAFQQNTSDSNDEATFWDQRLRFIAMLGKTGEIEFGFTADVVGHIAGLENGLTQSPYSSGEYGLGGGAGGVLRGKDWELIGAIHVLGNPNDGAFLGPRIDLDFTKTFNLGGVDLKGSARATTDFGQYAMDHTMSVRLPFPNTEKDKFFSMWVTLGTHMNGTFDGTPGVTGVGGFEFDFFAGRVKLTPMIAFDGEKWMPSGSASVTLFNFGSDFQIGAPSTDYHSQN